MKGLFAIACGLAAALPTFVGLLIAGYVALNSLSDTAIRLWFLVLVVLPPTAGILATWIVYRETSRQRQ